MLFKNQIHENCKERWQSRAPQCGEWERESHCGEGCVCVGGISGAQLQQWTKNMVWLNRAGLGQSAA